MPIYWELKEFLQRNDIKPPRLIADSRVQSRTIYGMINRTEPVDKLHSEAIDKILTTLSGYTGEVVTHRHILRFVPPGGDRE